MPSKDHAAYCREWRQKNPDKVIAMKRKRAERLSSAGSYSPQEWEDLVEQYHGLCLSCGYAETTVDHVIPISRGGSNEIHNIQPLCGKCNCIKGTQIIDYRV